jgi:hypothetical protein
MYQDYHSPIGINHTETMDMSLLYFYCIKNKYTVHKCMHTVQKGIYAVYAVHI